MKKSRLLEIIREEITMALNEISLEEDLLNEMPVLTVTNKNEFAKEYKDYLEMVKSKKEPKDKTSKDKTSKDKRIIASDAAKIILAILDQDGYLDTNALAKGEYSEKLAKGEYKKLGPINVGPKDTATYNDRWIRVLLNTPKGQDATADWSDYFQFDKGIITANPHSRGRKAGEAPKEKEKGEKKSEPKAKKEEKKSEPKAKKEEKPKAEPKVKPEPKAKEEESDAELAALEKAEKEFYSPEEEETSTVQEPSKKELEKTDKELKSKTQVPKELETKIKDVIAKKKAKLKAAGNNKAEFDKELTALKQWLNGKEIKKAINILGKETYDINTILKDIK
jgi:hypothetical protein